MVGTSSILRNTISYINRYQHKKRLITQCCDSSSLRHFSVSSSRKMKFVQFTYSDKPQDIRVGYVDGNNVVDINKNNSSLSSTLLGILRNGQLNEVEKLKSSAPSSVPLNTVTLAAPIHGIDKIICVGLNYADHCKEQNLTPPKVPMFFSKFASTIVGPNEPVKLRTDIVRKVDYEIELVVVIGKKASDVKSENAYYYVFGYTVSQDISARDWQKDKNGGQFLLGKAQDTFCPIGPWIVTKDEIPDPQKLTVRCSVNGDLRQNSNTDQLINKIPYIIERLTSVLTLLPGDIILTGTPGGVGLYRDPPEFLKPGDVIESEIEGIGTLRTNVVKF